MGKHLLGIIFLGFLFLLPAALAQEGEIYSLSVSPVQPTALTSSTLSVGVRNSDQTAHEYKLQILLVKDGVIKETNEYTFNLGPGKGTFFTPTFYADDIGKYNLIAKLFDKYETKLIDSKLLELTVVSDIGPFDLELNVPTDVARPGQVLPRLLTMANMGERGTDVEIKIELPCLNQSKIESSFFVFLKGGSTLERLTSLPTCEDEGLHDVFAHIILFNKTFMTSVNQIIINKTVAEIAIAAPAELLLEKNKMKAFDVSVKNQGSETIHNLKLFIEKIPLSWVTITPESLVEVAPGQTVVFIVNITAPEEASLESYPIKVAAAADEFLKRADSKIIFSPAGTVSAVPAPTSFDALGRFFSENFSTFGAVGLSLAGMAIAYVAIKKRRGKRSFAPERLGRLKSVIR